EDAQQLGVAHLLRIEDDADHLGVPGLPGAHFAIGRVRRRSAGVSGRGRDDARRLPELPLGAPEAAEAEERELGTLWKRRLEPRAVHEMWRGPPHLLGSPGQRP